MTSLEGSTLDKGTSKEAKTFIDFLKALFAMVQAVKAMDLK